MPLDLPEARLRPWAAFRRAGRPCGRGCGCAPRGERRPARGLPAPWTFSADARATERLERPRATPPCPPAHRAAILGPVPEQGPSRPVNRTSGSICTSRRRPGRWPMQRARRPGMLEGLAWFGGRETERQSKVDPIRDSVPCGRSFSGWIARETVDALWLPTARRVFGAALRARGCRAERLPAGVRGGLLLGVAGRCGQPAWLEGDRGPCPRDRRSQRTVGTHLGPEGWSWVVRCPTARVRPAATRAWACRHALAEGWRLAGQGPGMRSCSVDGQVALRLWQRGPMRSRTRPSQGWDVVLRHRTRTRGRLRAVMLETASCCGSWNWLARGPRRRAAARPARAHAVSTTPGAAGQEPHAALRGTACTGGAPR